MDATPEQLTRFQVFMKAVMEAADQGGEVTAPDGSRLRIAKHPEPGVELRVEPSSGDPAGLNMTLWEPAGERPDGYPADAPFIPDVAVYVTSWTYEGESLSQVQWQDVDDAAVLMQQVIEKSLAEGWSRVPSPEISPIAPLQMVQLERGGQKRILIGAGPAEKAFVIMSDTKR
ncbi:MAG: hypothetical protein GTN62_06975 [Gemmatimonadales bacterium]|nr:hypothetical protein [Gemmatimonadales bacterium]NIN11242.1 hypothetical protein [Gemmatimonadales bacterium]NIN49841.1 hypothetical protein [Gemmatimonadales bacterium]NIP07305.1 hypothetical protein [Gemmatimonadales bacterium]NIR03000.1 hypothetical protein [Gemmatimonadales bacterium]